ncbi:MAG: hypothetical protein ACI845_002091 [Gammaproteobacteria bacterium]|jgi:hypothetical protein
MSGPSPRIVPSLSLASCALLGLTSIPESIRADEWDLDLGLMTYQEDARNVGIEFLLNASRELADDDQVGFQVEVDTLTGATPNGATASDQAQTFTQASGAGQYQAGPGEIPVDDTHMDTRLALGLNYQDQYRDDIAIDYNGRISMEFDYLSFSAGHGWQFDFNQKNSSLNFALQGEYNRVHPVGNIPIELALMTPSNAIQNRTTAAKSKNIAEFSLGWTQVINRRSICQINTTQSHFSGYLNDPYKIVSIIDDSDPGNLGGTLAYRYEKRPGKRDLSSYFIGCKQNINGNQLDVSLRSSQDDWGIKATVLDLRYSIKQSDGSSFQPRVRFYRQTAADFYRHSLPESEGLPDSISADTRIAAYDAITIGFKYSIQEIDNKQHSLTFDYYEQSGEKHPADAIGLQKSQNLFPALRAAVFRYLFSTRW